MDKKTLRALAMTLVPAAMLACVSCSSTPQGQSSTEVFKTEGGKTMVETYETTATVTAIDPTSRHITLTSPDGRQMTVKAGPEVRNFDQIRVGDQVRATASEMVAVSLRPQGTPAPAGAGESSSVTVAPRGAKPSVMSVDTSEVAARITALDSQRRTVTLQFPDGSTKKVKVGDDVDLTKPRVGDDVVIRVTESVAIRVEKP